MGYLDNLTRAEVEQAVAKVKADAAPRGDISGEDFEPLIYQLLNPDKTLAEVRDHFGYMSLSSDDSGILGIPEYLFYLILALPNRVTPFNSGSYDKGSVFKLPLVESGVLECEGIGEVFIQVTDVTMLGLDYCYDASPTYSVSRSRFGHGFSTKRWLDFDKVDFSIPPTEADPPIIKVSTVNEMLKAWEYYFNYADSPVEVWDEGENVC